MHTLPDSQHTAQAQPTSLCMPLRVVCCAAPPPLCPIPPFVPLLCCSGWAPSSHSRTGCSPLWSYATPVRRGPYPTQPLWRLQCYICAVAAAPQDQWQLHGSAVVAQVAPSCSPRNFVGGAGSQQWCCGDTSGAFTEGRQFQRHLLHGPDSALLDVVTSPLLLCCMQLPAWPCRCVWTGW